MLQFLFRTRAGAVLLWEVTQLLRLLFVSMLTLMKIRQRKAHTKAVKQVASEVTENERLAGCREVVLEYADCLGFIAREVINRQELEELIDNGIQPDDLAWEIHQRIEATPGIMLGEYRYANGAVPIKLPDSLRDRHCYIIGRSGSGKTNLIRIMAMQDIAFGNGIGIVAPEQELITEEILPYIPEDRIDDVVYINPDDTDAPIPLNPLHLDDEAKIDLAVDDNLTIFKRLMGETQARMDEILRQTLYALLARPGSTLQDVEKLLNRGDDTFRKEIIRTSRDEQTRYFFASTYPAFPKDAHLPITTRINRLVRPKAVRTLLCQPGRSFNFRQAMDAGKILLFNLSDGILGEQQTAQLLGQLIVSKIQMAVLSRMDTPQALRRPFYLYLDEFQTFTGVAETSYSKMLSRARKYHLGLILAHQQTGQLTKNLLDEIFGNVTTFITFSVAYGDAMRLSQQYIMKMGGEMRPLPEGEFVNQKVGEAIGKIGQTVFKLRTPLAPQQPSHRRAEYIQQRSRQNYGMGETWRADMKRQTPKLLPPKGVPPKNTQDDMLFDDDPSELF